MNSTQDLIEHFRLEVEFRSEYTKHTFYRSDRAQGRRKEKVEEAWRRERQLGQGASGAVWLERERHSNSERAVKAIRKSEGLLSSVKYYEKEILAMAKLSKVGVEC